MGGGVGPGAKRLVVDIDSTMTTNLGEPRRVEQLTVARTVRTQLIALPVASSTAPTG